MTFEELILKRRSIRNYQDIPVPKETIMSIIQDYAYAPSSGNEQPWRFVIVTNRRLMKTILDESKVNRLYRIACDPNDYANKYENILGQKDFNIFYNAPCVVYLAICWINFGYKSPVR